MQKSFYDTIARPFEEDGRKQRFLIRTNRFLTWVFYPVYALLLLGRIFHWDVRFWRILFVPAVTFVLVTVVRWIANSPRPYEVWNEPPLIAKETAGRSCPSRHVFSAVMISMTALWLGFHRLGVLLMAFSVILAAIRVTARVHFVRDVVIGAAAAVGLALLGYWVL